MTGYHPPHSFITDCGKLVVTLQDGRGAFKELGEKI
jgi:hypothetical protein